MLILLKFESVIACNILYLVWLLGEIMHVCDDECPSTQATNMNVVFFSGTVRKGFYGAKLHVDNPSWAWHFYTHFSRQPNLKISWVKTTMTDKNSCHGASYYCMLLVSSYLAKWDMYMYFYVHYKYIQNSFHGWCGLLSGQRERFFKLC